MNELSDDVVQGMIRQCMGEEEQDGSEDAHLDVACGKAEFVPGL